MPAVQAKPDTLDHITSLLSPGGVVTTAADMASYESGARFDIGRAAFVLRPATVGEVSACLAWSVRTGTPLVPQSGNTGLLGGSTPDGTGQQGVLSLDRLKSRFSLDAANRTVEVDAGFRLSEINQRLAPEGLFFPIDLAADPAAGGMVATNTGGARFVRYGDVRRNTLGIQVVLADAAGTVLQLGSGLRKDNTGPDWKQLFIGTSGVFGVVTACTFNVEPVPRQSATAYLVPRSDLDADSLLRRMEDAVGNYLTAFEGLSGEAIRCALDHVPSLRNPFAGGNVPPFVILAELTRNWAPREGEQSLESVLETTLGVLFELDDSPLVDALIGRTEEMWALRHALSEGVKAAGLFAGFDLSFRRGDVARYRRLMREELARTDPDVEVCDFGHVGDGGIHLNLASRSPLAPADVDRIRRRVIAVAVEDFGGSFSAEHGIGRKNQEFYDRYTPQRLRDLSCFLKRETSPGPIGSISLG